MVKKEDTIQLKDRKSKENVIILGYISRGKVTHPWDHIPPCECGCQHPLMSHNDGTLWNAGDSCEDIVIKCPVCNSYKPKGFLDKLHKKQ